MAPFWAIFTFSLLDYKLSLQASVLLITMPAGSVGVKESIEGFL